MQDENNSLQSFSKWRLRLLPVKGKELFKFLPLLLIKLCVSFNYTILHSTKDTLIVTGKGSGAEVIPLLKGGVVLIAAFIFMLIYSRLSNRLTPSKLFYVTLTPFLIFFLVYGFFLYPNREWLSPHDSADKLQAFLGEGRAHFVVVYRYWMDSLFFLMAELWGGVVIALLFWGFANRINTLSEASRFYPILSAGGHIGVIASGPLLWKVSNLFPDNYFEGTVKVLMGIVALVIFLILLLYSWTDKYASPPAKPKEKNSLTLHEGLFQVLKSPSLACIALMVIGYGLSVNMIEVLWKATLKLHYPSAKEYQAFMGIISTAVGTVSLILALCAGGNILRKMGWHFSAQLTPIVLGLTSTAFLALYFWGGAFGITSLTSLVIIGAIHNVSCKSMKYCLFDPTKEMAYIPLNDDIKVKGKAAVDVVASRFGKSGSSWIQISLMEVLGTSSVLTIAPYLAPFILTALFAWSASIYYLEKKQAQNPVSITS